MSERTGCAHDSIFEVTADPEIFCVSCNSERGPVLAFAGRKNNALLIEDLRRLGHLGDDRKTIDPTYNIGRFWKSYTPPLLTRCDIVPKWSPDVKGGMDATKLHEHWGPEFDAVVIDGPYKLNGTPSQGGPAMSDEGYGVGVPTRWQDRHALLEAMMRSGAQLLRPPVKGQKPASLLFKCQDQVVSGKKRFQSQIFGNLGESLGLRLADALYVEGYRAQPDRGKQVHAHQDFSVMLVFVRERK